MPVSNAALKTIFIDNLGQLLRETHPSMQTVETVGSRIMKKNTPKLSGANEIRLMRLVKVCSQYGLHIQWGAWGLGGEHGEAAKRFHAWNGCYGREYRTFTPSFRDGRLCIICEKGNGFRECLSAHTLSEMRAAMKWLTLDVGFTIKPLSSGKISDT